VAQLHERYMIMMMMMFAHIKKKNLPGIYCRLLMPSNSHMHSSKWEYIAVHTL